MKVLIVTTESIGGRGGIAQYNKDVIQSLILNTEIEEIVLIQKLQREFVTIDSRNKLLYRKYAVKNSLFFIFSIFYNSIFRKNDVILCGHINYLWLIGLFNIFSIKKIILFVYGIEVWTPGNLAAGYFLRRLNKILSISQYTVDRMQEWIKLEKKKIYLAPNAIHLDQYKIQGKPEYLLEKYGIQSDTKIIFTLCRLDANEKYKGVDAVLDILPALSETQKVHYVIGGDGTDKERLEDKVKILGIGKFVTFTGYISESEKNDHYSLADLFVMPSKGEGFGFVYLESLANGVPVVASNRDGGQDALLNGELGELVDPDSPVDILRVIAKCLARQDKRAVNPRINYFSFSNFHRRLGEYLKIEKHGA